MASQCRHWDKSKGNVSEHVHGVKGTADLSQFTITYRDGKTWSHPRRGQKDPYQVEHDDFFKAIRSNQAYNEADNGIDSTMTAILGRMATYSGEEITWEQGVNSNLDLIRRFTISMRIRRRSGRTRRCGLRRIARAGIRFRCRGLSRRSSFVSGLFERHLVLLCAAVFLFCGSCFF